MGTNGKRRYPPNKRLTWQRLQKGWSREELVRQIALSMKAHGETDTGLTADTVRRWESGDRWPEPRFRKHLVLVFGMPASELGLLTSDELDMRPDDERDPTDSAVLDAMRRLFMADEPAGFGRQQFLRALLAAGMSPLIASATLGEADAAWRAPGTRRDPRSVDAFAKITATHRELYWSSEPAVLFEASLSHLRLGLRLLDASPDSLHRGETLAAAVAETALLSARLAFFDLGQLALADRCFAYAEAAVARSGDHALAAAVAAHRAFPPGFAGDPVTTQRHLDVAHAHARYGGGPNLRAWLQCVSAEVHARTGQLDSAKDRIRQAEHALSTRGTDPVWLDYFDEARLAGFAGNAELLAGRNESAARWLTKALDNLDDNGARQRAVVLFDLAAAHASSDADHATALAHDACTILESNFYRTAYERIPTVQRALEGTRGGAELSERASELRPLAAGA